MLYKISIPHFHFPVHRTGAYRHKNALELTINNRPLSPLKNNSTLRLNDTDMKLL